jgi:transcription factor SPN1
MEDVEFVRSHSHSPLPEAGNEPEDPLAPEIDEENGTQTMSRRVGFPTTSLF